MKVSETKNTVYVMFYILVTFWLHRMECKGNMMKLHFYVFMFVNNTIEKIDNDNVKTSELFIKHILEKIMFIYTCNWKRNIVKIRHWFCFIRSKFFDNTCYMYYYRAEFKRVKINGWILHHMDDRCPILNNFIRVLLWLVLLEPYIILKSLINVLKLCAIW